MTALIVVVLLTVIVSAHCSLFESTLYSTRSGTLESALEGPRADTASRMMRLKENIATPIAAILIVNTIANTAGATLSGMYADRALGARWVPLFSIGLTLSILFFAEIIPKTVGATHWRGLWPWIVTPLRIMGFALYPFIRLINWTTRRMTPSHATPPVTEEDILGAIRLGAAAGELTQWEGLMARNVIQLEEKKARDIMTPRTVVFALDENTSVADAFAAAMEKKYTRIPVYEESIDQVTGYITINELASASVQAHPDRPIKELIKPVTFVPTTVNCARLLVDFLRHRRHLAMVIDEYGGIAGLVALEDLIETVLGAEIVDEHDMAEDLRLVAEKRAERLREERSTTSGDPEPD